MSRGGDEPGLPGVPATDGTDRTERLRGLASRLRADVASLCPDEGRVVGSAGHERARSFLVDRLDALALPPYGPNVEMAYRFMRTVGTNIVATVPGRDRDKPPILLGAHYDSVLAAPCADDNAAAVAIVLALAERLPRGVLSHDVVLAFFDAEEPPHYLGPEMGSVRFHDDQMDPRGVHAAVVLDLVGHAVGEGTPTLGDVVFVTGADSDPALAGVFREEVQSSDLPLVATAERYVGDMSDYAVFRWHGAPYLFFSCGRWEHYHAPTDTPDRLDYRKMALLTGVLESFLRRLDGTDLHRARHAEPSHDLAPASDTLGLEIDTLRRAMGPLVDRAMRRMRVEALHSRRDLDMVVAGLLTFVDL